MTFLRAVAAALAIWGGIDILIRIFTNPVPMLTSLALVAVVVGSCAFQSALWRRLGL